VEPNSYLKRADFRFYFEPFYNTDLGVGYTCAKKSLSLFLERKPMQ